MLFTPFLELRQLQGFMIKPKNDNLGLGLAATRTIVKKLGGDLFLKQSTNGLTVFKLRFPVTTQRMQENIFNHQK